VLCQTLDEAKCKKWLFVTKANLTQNGRHHYHSDLSNFFEWLRFQNHVGVNPWVRVPKPEKLPTETGILSIWQAGLLLEAARHEDLIAPIVLGLFCGVRPKRSRAYHGPTLSYEGRIRSIPPFCVQGSGGILFFESLDVCFL